MDTEKAFNAIFWSLLVLGPSMRSWFAFRVSRTERILPDRAAREREGWLPRAIERLFELLLAALLLSVCFQGGSVVRKFDFPAPDWLRWAGAGLGIASLGLFAWTHVTLGRFWSTCLQLRSDHQLVTTGPYARIRHPMYSAILGWMMSLGLVAANWLPFVFATATALNFILRIRPEEKMMLQQFGDEYREYMKRSGRLLPV